MFTNLTGRRFGKLKVKKLDHKEQCYSKNGKKHGWYYFYLCECDCGNTKIINGRLLTSKHTQSCGCSYYSQNNKSHTRLYKILDGIKGRCLYPKNNRYKFYGAKGVKLCPEWYDYKNFEKWALENGYNDELTIDRIDINGNYEPNNCRWVDIKTQARNKTNNVLITYQNETHCLTEWAEILGIKNSILRDRIRRKWDIKRAFTTPVKNS